MHHHDEQVPTRGLRGGEGHHKRETYHKSLLGVLVLRFIRVPLSTQSAVTLGDFLAIWGPVVFEIKAQNLVAIIVPAKDGLWIIVGAPIHVGLGVEDFGFLGGGSSSCCKRHRDGKE